MDWSLLFSTTFFFSAAYVVSMFFSDVVHYLLHRFSESRLPALRLLGSLHQTHHDFWNEELKFNFDLSRKNYWHHLVPEYLSAAACGVCLFAIFPPLPVAMNLAWLTLLVVQRAFTDGRDTNHQVISTLSPPRKTLLIGLKYHAHHHVYPTAFYGSTIKLLDTLLGTVTPIRGRRFLITGANGAFGGPMKRLLEENGAAEVIPLKHGVDFSYDDYSKAELKMANAEVLVLCHGTKGESAFEANAASFVKLIEKFRHAPRPRCAPREVWAVGSEVECHPSSDKTYYDSKRAFARVARGYYRQDAFVYRHIVPSAFQSPMGMGLMSGTFAAKVALFLIRRGATYVPVSYSGVAFLNYFKFLFRWHAQTPDAFLSQRDRATRSRPRVSTTRRVTCLIPAYNEGTRIDGVLAAVSRHPLIDEVLVIDDGSTDGTADRLKGRDDIKLISLPKNRGKSFAISHGMTQASHDLLINLDADLVGLTEENITALIRPVLDGEADVTLSLRSNALNVYKILGLDFVSGERVFSRSLFPSLDDVGRLRGFELEAFMNRQIIERNLRLRVVPWKSVIGIRKSGKFGLWEGTVRDAKMALEVFHFLGLSELVRQFRGLRAQRV